MIYAHTMKASNLSSALAYLTQNSHIHNTYLPIEQLRMQEKTYTTIGEETVTVHVNKHTIIVQIL